MRENKHPLSTHKYPLGGFFSSMNGFSDGYTNIVPAEERTVFSCAELATAQAYSHHQLSSTKIDSHKRLPEEQVKRMFELLFQTNEALVYYFKDKKFFTAFQFAKLGYMLAQKCCDPSTPDHLKTRAISAYQIGATLDEIGDHTSARPFLEEAAKLSQKASETTISEKASRRLDQVQMRL